MRNFIIGIFAIMLSGCGGGFKASQPSLSHLSSLAVCTPGTQQSCQADNGTGSQICNSAGSAWGACANLTSCNSGFNLQNGACVANVCSPNAQQTCQTGNGTGSQTCNGSGSAWGACGNLTSCNSGFNLQSGACVANVCNPNAQQSCKAGGGTGSQSCNSSGSAWGACGNITSCSPGYSIINGVCLVNFCTPNAQQSCQTGNGTGSQTCGMGAWGSCGNLTSCNSGYNLQNGVCVANTCTPNTQQGCQTGNGTGSKACNSVGSAWGACGNLTSCNAGYNLQNGACVANACTPNAQQSCQTGNGTGSQACNSAGSAWGTCSNLTSCNSGYNLQSGACVANNCTPNTQHSCQSGNGTGSQTCSSPGSAWGDCGNLTNCNSGFNLQNGACVSNFCTPYVQQQTCNSGNGSGAQTCNSAGSGYGQCLVTSCPSGYTLSNNSCALKSLSIGANPVSVPAGGSSTLTWNVAGASSCLVTSNGYSLWGGTSETVNTATYGGNIGDTTYTLTCTMNDGSQQSGQVTVMVPVQVSASAFTFSAMRGGNIFDGDFWFSNGPNLAAPAAQMNLNFERINMNLYQAVSNGTEDTFIQDLSATLNALAAQNMKVILVFGGYIEYDQACSPYGSFLTVQPLAQRIITTFKGHPTIYAWELMNEAISTMVDGEGCDRNSTIKAVNAMFQMVHTLDPTTPTSVSEAWYYWELPTWANVSSFASFHIYPPVTSPLTTDQLATAQNLLSTNIAAARAAVPSIPLMMGEFGVTGLTQSDTARFYQSMYQVLSSQNIGSFFWDLSTTDAAYGILNSDGSFTPAALVVRSVY